MKLATLTLAICALLGTTQPALARSTIDVAGATGGGGGELPAVLQCVPYARQVTGIQIYGDAHTWWAQADGRYRRGHEPKVGAVMAVRPHANSRLGHVAAVSRIVDERTILLRHANWSQPGMIENDVKAIDVSPANDWSQVRIWYEPSNSLGTSSWPLYGFIYGEQPARQDRSAPRTARSSDLIGDIIAGRHR